VGADSSGTGPSPVAATVEHVGNGDGPRVGLVFERAMLAHADAMGVCEERPARITAIYDRLQEAGLAQRCVRRVFVVEGWQPRGGGGGATVPV
jgi:hypothetical protein